MTENNAFCIVYIARREKVENLPTSDLPRSSLRFSFTVSSCKLRYTYTLYGFSTKRLQSPTIYIRTLLIFPFLSQSHFFPIFLTHPISIDISEFSCAYECASLPAYWSSSLWFCAWKNWRFALMGKWVAKESCS